MSQKSKKYVLICRAAGCVGRVAPGGFLISGARKTEESRLEGGAHWHLKQKKNVGPRMGRGYGEDEKNDSIILNIKRV